jgi:excinuclease ABC subunit C
MDGGKGHVSTALEVIDATELGIPVVGMVKDDKHRTRALIYRKKDSDEYEEIPLAGKNLLFKYIGRMQEEVHRFAIEYHRNVRNKRVGTSVLDDIEGIGPARRTALLEHFKSVDNIKAATLEELENAPSMNRKAAENVRRYFNK